MCKRIFFYLVLGAIVLFALQCKKPYTPVALIKGDNYMVVDGFINTSPGGITTVLLSRTKNLTDTVVSLPEQNAFVAIVAANGIQYTLHETGSNGAYSSDALTLNPAGQYKVVVTTADNRQYQSDLVTAKTNPPIDSITWRQDSKGVNLFVNTHDPSNNTRFYRWQYIQTWEYHSQLETPWDIANGVVFPRDPLKLRHICYNTSYSTDVWIGSSAALSQDVISEAPLGTIVQNDSTLEYRASFLVQQYALTPQAYFYWQIIQKNSQQLGTLFDLQPSQLEGNIHSITNASEPVVGFISASPVQEKRIFINNKDLRDWQPPPGSYNCSIIGVPQNPVNFALVNLPDDSYAPWYFVTGGPVMLAQRVCLDCTLSGGTITKPAFW